MDMFTRIDEIINAPTKTYTTKEAKELLYKYGVVTRKNAITKAYRDIIVKVKNEKGNGSK